MADLSLRLAGVVSALLAAACATAAEPRVNARAAAFLDKFERTGDVTDCLSLARISEIRPVSEDLFLVRAGVGDWYVNEVSGRCSGATRGGARLEYSTSLSQLCRNEIIRVVDNSAGFLAGSCGLGSFERLEEKADAGEEGL